MAKRIETEGYKTPAIEVLSIAVTRPVAQSSITTDFDEGNILPDWDLSIL